MECDTLKNKIVKAEAILDAKKKKSSEATAEADNLRTQLSGLNEHNKKLIEESGKNEVELQDYKAKLKELEESLNLEKVSITQMLFCCCYLELLSYVFISCSTC